MNLASRIALATTAMALLSSGFWAFLLPHFIYQYALILGASSVFGGAMFAITDTDEDEVEKELKEQKEIASKYQEVEKFSDRYSDCISDLYLACRDILNPVLNRKFDRIYKIAVKINDYGKENDCLDKLNVWNEVYVKNITKLIKEFNKVYSLPDQTPLVTSEIENFTKLSDEIEENFKKQYDDLVSGRIKNFMGDMQLVRQVHEMRENS